MHEYEPLTTEELKELREQYPDCEQLTPQEQRRLLKTARITNRYNLF